MALVLSLKIAEAFMVEGQRVVVSDVLDASELTLTLPNGKSVKVTEFEGTEIFPDVFVSAAGFYKWGQVRIAIEAPRSIAIMREDRWNEQQRHRRKFDGVS